MPQTEVTSPKSSEFLLRRFWNWLTSPSSSLTDIGEQRAARLASSFLFAITLFDFIGAFARIPRLGLQGAFAGGLGFSLLFAFVAYAVSRTKWYRVAIFLFSLSFCATAYFSIVTQGDQADFSTLILVYVPLGLIVASSFLSAWAVFLLVGLNIGAYLSIQLFGVSLPDNVGAQAGIIIVIGVVLMLLANFRDRTENSRFEEIQRVNQELESLGNELEQRVEIRTEELALANQKTAHRTEQLTAIAELARSLTDIQDLETLLPAITTFVSQRLSYYHVGIFLNDENEIFSVLRATNSEGGQKMMERGHRLRIGTEGIVGYVVNAGRPRIALDVGADAVYFDNPELPDTHSEMALPLRLGSEIIGALDIQSTEANAFSTEDMSIFSTLADQVAIAIQNARLLAQAQAALRDVETAYAQQTARAWQDFSKSHSIDGYRFDGLEPKPIDNSSNSNTKFDSRLTLPMRLRGQTIGKLKFKTIDENRVWSQEEIALAEAALERAAIALENARLLEEAQRRAAREFTTSEVANKISSSTNIDTILRSTVEELGRKIPGAQVAFEISSELQNPTVRE
jgi:GAF domain-containing protein